MGTQNGSNNPLLRVLANGNGGNGGSTNNVNSNSKLSVGSQQSQAPSSPHSALMNILRQKSNAGENTARQRLQTGHTAPKSLGAFTFSGDYDTDTKELQNRRNNTALWTKYLSALEADIEAGEKLYRSTKSEDDYKRYETTVDQYNRAVEEANPVYEQYKKDYDTYQNKYAGQILLHSGRDYSDYSRDELDLALSTKQQEYDAFKTKWGEDVVEGLKAARQSMSLQNSALRNYAYDPGLGLRLKQDWDAETLDRLSYDAVKLEQELNQLKYQKEISDAYEVVQTLDAETQEALREVATSTGSGAPKAYQRKVDKLKEITGWDDAKVREMREATSYYFNAKNAEQKAAKAEARAEKNPGLATLGTVLTQPIAGLSGTVDFALQGLTNGEKPIDIYAPQQMLGHKNATVREAVARDIESGDTTMALGLIPNPTDAEDGKLISGLRVNYSGVDMPDWMGGQNLGSFAYQMGTSALDSAYVASLSAAVGSALGAAGVPIETATTVRNSMVNVLMGSSAARDTTATLLKQGVPDEQAVAAGLLSGAIEGLTEAANVDNIFKVWSSKDKAFARKWLAANLSEGTEEWMSNVLNRTLVEPIYNGGLPALKTKYYANIDSGMSEKDAFKEAVITTVGEDVSAIMAGFLSSTPMSSVAYVSNKRTQKRESRAAEAAKPVNPVEAKYNEVSAANPDKTVMHPIATELTEAGYPDAKKAIKQGEILEKVFNGETITDAELDALDMNDSAVRAVFAKRSGLSGVTDVADLTRQLKRGLVDQAAADVLKYKATQEAAAATTQQVVEQQKEAAKDGGKGIIAARKANAESREQQIQQAKAEAQTRELREQSINVEGKNEAAVVAEVEQRSGATGVQTMSAFAQTWMQEQGVEELDPRAMAQMVQAYREYLGTVNVPLSRAEVTALVSAGTRAVHDEAKAIRSEFETEGENKSREALQLIKSIRERGIDLPSPIEFLAEWFEEDGSLKGKREDIDEIRQLYAAQARSLGVSEADIQQILEAFEYELTQIFGTDLTNKQDSGNANITTESEEDTNEREKRSGNGRSSGERRGGTHDSGGAGAVSEGSGQHEVHDDRRGNVGRDSGRARGGRGLISAKELFGSEELGTDEANLRVLTDEEIAANAEWAAVKKSIEESGGKAVLLTGESIHALVDGKRFDIRGAVNHATGEVFIVVDNKDASATEIKDHELFHLWARRDKKIFNAVKRALINAGIGESVIKVLAVYQKKYPYKNAKNKYYEEIFGDANAEINPFNIPEMEQITKVVKEVMASEEVQERIRAIKEQATASEPDMRFSMAVKRPPKGVPQSEVNSFGEVLAPDVAEYFEGSYARLNEDPNERLKVLFSGAKNIDYDIAADKNAGVTYNWMSDRWETGLDYAQLSTDPNYSDKMYEPGSKGEILAKKNQRMQEQTKLMFEALGLVEEEDWAIATELEVEMNPYKSWPKHKIWRELEAFTESIKSNEYEAMQDSYALFRGDRDSAAVTDPIGLPWGELSELDNKEVRFALQKRLSDLGVTDASIYAVGYADEIVSAVPILAKDVLVEKLEGLEDIFDMHVDLESSEGAAALNEVRSLLEILKRIKTAEDLFGHGGIVKRYINRAVDMISTLLASPNGFMANTPPLWFSHVREVVICIRGFSMYADKSRMEAFVNSVTDGDGKLIVYQLALYGGAEYPIIASYKQFAKKVREFVGGLRGVNGAGVIAEYARIRKPYIVNAMGHVWDDLAESDVFFDAKDQLIAKSKSGKRPSSYSYGRVRTGDVCDWARMQTNADGSPKYDGVIFKNIMEKRSTAAKLVNYYIVWESNNVKSIYNEHPTEDDRFSFSADPSSPFTDGDDIDESMIQGYNPYEDMSADDAVESQLEEKFVHRYPSDFGEYEPASKKRRLSAFERDVGKANLDDFLKTVINRRGLILNSAAGQDLMSTYLSLPKEVRDEAERITYGRADHTRHAYRPTGAAGSSGEGSAANEGDRRTLSGQTREDELRGVLRNAEGTDAERNDRHFYSVTGKEVNFPKGTRTDNLIPLSLDDIKRDPILLGQWVKNAAYGAETFFVTSNGEGILTNGGDGAMIDAAGFCTDRGIIVVCVDLNALNPKFISSHERFHWLCNLTQDIMEESPLILDFFKKYKSHVNAADMLTAFETYDQDRTDVESPYSVFSEMFSDIYAGGGGLIYQNAGLDDDFVQAVRSYIAKQFKGAAVRKRVKELGLPDFSFSISTNNSDTNNYLNLSDEALRERGAERYAAPHSHFSLDFGMPAETFDQLNNRQKILVYLSMFGVELETLVGFDMRRTKAAEEARTYAARVAKGDLTAEQAAREIYENTHEADTARKARRDEAIKKTQEDADRRKRYKEAEPRIISEATEALSKPLKPKGKTALLRGAKSVGEFRKTLEDDTDKKAEKFWKARIKVGKSTNSFYEAPAGQQILSYLSVLKVDLLTEVDGEFVKSRAVELAEVMQAAANSGIITPRAAAEAIQARVQNPSNLTVNEDAEQAIRAAKNAATTNVETKPEEPAKAEEPVKPFKVAPPTQKTEAPAAEGPSTKASPKVEVKLPEKSGKAVKFAPPAPNAKPQPQEAPNFVKDVFETTPGSPLVVTFKGGKTANYTTNVLTDLLSDPDVERIVGAEKGSVVYESQTATETAPNTETVAEGTPVQETGETATEAKTESTPKKGRGKSTTKKNNKETPRKKGAPRKQALPKSVETEKEREQFKEAFDETHGEGASEQLLGDEVAQQVLGVLNKTAAALGAAEEKLGATEEKLGKTERALEAALARVAELEQKEKGAESRKEARRTISLETHKQEIKRLNRIIMDNARTDKAWAKGLAESADRFARAEERKIAERRLREQRIKAREEKNRAVKAANEKAEARLEEQREAALELQRKLRADAKADRQWARGLAHSQEDNLKAEGAAAVARTKKQIKHENTMAAKKAKQTLAHRRHTGPTDPANNGSGAVLNAHEVMEERKRVLTAAEKLRTAGRTLYRNFVSATAEIEAFGRRQLSKIRADVLVNIMGAYMDTVQAISENNLLGRDGRILGNSMQDTFLCWKGEGKKREWDSDAQQTLKEYMVYMHTVELMSFESRAWERVFAFEAQYPFFVDMPSAEFASLVADKNPLALEYTRLMRQAETAKNKAVLADEDGKPVSAETAKAAADKLAELQPWVVDKANEIYQWWDAFMREWAVGTQLSLEQYENMRDMYPHYIPLHRVMDGVGPGGSAFARDGYIGTGKVTHKIKGSVLPIQELEDQFYSSVQRIVRLNRANELYRNIVEEAMFDDTGEFAEFAIFDWDGAEAALKQDLWDYDSDVDNTGLSEDGRQYKVSAYIDGVKVSAFVNKGMYDGLAFVTGAKSDRLSKVAALGSKLTGPMKTLLTGINPLFAARNVSRDVPTAVVNSISGAAFPKYWAQAAAEIAKNSEHWQRFLALGGGHAEYYNMESGYAKALAEQKNIIGKAVDVMGSFNNVTEAQTRFAEYLATIDRMPGGDTYENRLLGIKNSAEVTVDFSRSGIYGRLVNAWVPYWNPAVQGVDKLFRSVFQQPDIKKAAATVGRAAMVTIVPEILMYALRKALDREEEWRELSDYVKDSYYCIPLKDEHKFLRIPKNREWGAILGTSFMRMLEGVNGVENPFENYFETSINANFLPPEILSNAFGVSWALELAKNEDFAGSSIVPYAYQDVSKSEQYDADTSAAAYLIAKAGNLFADWLSPMQLDYIMQDYIGDFYGLLLKSVPVGLFTGEVTGEDIGNEIKSTLSGSWVSDNRYSNDTVSEYYAMLDAIDQEVANLKLRDPNYEESTQYKMRSALNTSDGYAKRISNLNADARMLPNGPEKDAIKEQIVDLAAEALEFYNRVTSGEISDPKLYTQYAEYGDSTAKELVRLDSYAKEYAFEPSEPASKKITDPDSRIREYILTEDQKDKYAEFYNAEYTRLAKQTMQSFAYKNETDVGKVTMLEAMNLQARENATSELVGWMSSTGVQPEIKEAYREYDNEILDMLVYLDSYQSSEAYNFMPRDDSPDSYVDPDNNKYKYYLNDYYKDQYMRIYQYVYKTSFYSVVGDPEFQLYTSAQMASRLHDMKEDVGDLAKECIITLMKRDNYLPELRDTRAKY